MIADPQKLEKNDSPAWGDVCLPQSYRESLHVLSCGGAWFSATHHPGCLSGHGENATIACRSRGVRLTSSGYVRAILVFAAVVFLVTGCSMTHPYGQSDIGTDYNILAGNIYSEAPHTGSIVVAAYREKQDQLDVVDYTILHKPGPYELMVPYGSYHVLAFGDENKDHILEKKEPSGIYGYQMPQSIIVNGITVCPDIVISNEHKATTDYPSGLALPQDMPENIHTRPTGEIAVLNDGLFDERYGIQGYWSPEDFLREIGANIFMLEEYDPDRIPVLFIHGATGSPRGWRPFVESMDRTRFQPWFYYYPTGAPVKSMSDFLYWKLSNLRKKYHFGDMLIVAHSMGGLVARSFIMDFGERFPLVRLFLSISTPWGGDKLAEYGVKHSPVVIPCWYDMQPGGNFLKSLYSRHMPEGIDFYLFFGHKGNRNPFRSNNDGTISMASLLDLRSQSEAKMIIGFNEDHDSILSSKEVLLKYNTILDKFKSQNYNNGTASQKIVIDVNAL